MLGPMETVPEYQVSIKYRQPGNKINDGPDVDEVQDSGKGIFVDCFWVQAEPF